MKTHINDIDAIYNAIKEAAGKAHEHVHTVQNIQDDARALHLKLLKNLSQNLLVGTVFKLTSRPCLPKSYGNRKVIFTEVKVEVFPSGLFVVDIKRCEGWATSTQAKNYALLPEPIKKHLSEILYQKEITL